MLLRAAANCILFACVWNALPAQSTPTREYIRAGGKLVAIEIKNFGAPTAYAPTTVSASPTNNSGWANVFEYKFSDLNGAADITEAEVSYSESASLPFANSCRFVYTKSLNAVRLYNDAASAFVSGSISPSSSGSNIGNSRCTLIGGSLVVSTSGNDLTLRIGIGFATGTTRTYTTRLFARDATLNSGWVSHGTWTIPSQVSAPYGAGASGATYSTSIHLSVWLSDAQNVSISQLDIDDIQTSIPNSGGSTVNACHFFYFAPADSLVLMAADDIRWQGVTKIGAGGTTISNGFCSINGASTTKSYDSTYKRLTVTVPVTAIWPWNGYKDIYVAGSDRSGMILSNQWVSYWQIP
jgi:hypothetical protein